MLNQIINSKIVAITFIHDYFQIAFDDEKSLSIYNKYKINQINDYRSLIYKVVLSIEMKNNSIILNLTDNTSISIWLADSDYNWPEAFQLNLPDWTSIIE